MTKASKPWKRRTAVASPAVAFVGRHNSGKTTLIERVIGEMDRARFRRRQREAPFPCGFRHRHSRQGLLSASCGRGDRYGHSSSRAGGAHQHHRGRDGVLRNLGDHARPRYRRGRGLPEKRPAHYRDHARGERGGRCRRTSVPAGSAKRSAAGTDFIRWRGRKCTPIARGDRRERERRGFQRSAGSACDDLAHKMPTGATSPW